MTAPAKGTNIQNWLSKTNNKGMNALELIRVIEQLLPSLKNKARSKVDAKNPLSLGDRLDKLKRLFYINFD